MKYFLRFFVFASLLLFFLHICARILIPNKQDNIEVTMSEYFSMAKKNIDIQVLLLGNSHMEHSFSPIELWNDHKIVSYNLSSSAAPFALDYFMLKEALRTQKPKIVVFDVGNLFSRYAPIEDKAWSINSVVDDIPFSKSKVSLVHYLATQSSDESFNEAFWGAFFPLYKYHSRWKSLRHGYFNKKTASGLDFFACLGHILSMSIIPSQMITEDEINWYVEYSKDGFEPRYNCELDSEAVAYLEAMKNLCREFGINLLAVKIPVNISPGFYGTSAWTYEKHEKIKNFMAEQGIPFIDLKYDLSAPIDWKYDTQDEGRHLNELGAKKITKVLGSYLVSNYDLPPQECSYYDYCACVYNKISYASDLELTYNLLEYVKKLNNQYKNTTVLISAKDDMMEKLSDEEKYALNSLGCTVDFNPSLFSYSYIVVLKNGIMQYENLQKPKQEYSFDLDDEHEVKITSGGWLSQSLSEIKIKGTEYGMNHRGINIVVLDNESGLVLDSVCFDTWLDGNHDAIRDNSKVWGYFAAYKDYVLQEEGRK